MYKIFALILALHPLKAQNIPDTLEQIATAPPKRAHHEMVYDEASKTILLTGGSTPMDGGRSFVFYNDLWRFDGKAWKQSGEAGDKRSGIRMAYSTKEAKIYSYGGFMNNQPLADLRVLENGNWRTISNDPEMEAAEPGFVYDSHRDKLIAFGGTSARNKINRVTWQWDGKSWMKFEGNQPEGRQAFAMIYDSKRKRTVLFGGMNATGKMFEDGVWEFDGNEWKNIPVSGGPEPRMCPGYAYDSKRGSMLVFGGAGQKGILSDMWSWNGKEWKKLADAGPAQRMMGYMAYHKDRDRVVLFGGRLGWPNDTNDTWEWDGTAWKELK